MQAAILTIGTEITRGELVNTNASWLGMELCNAGIEVCEHRSVRDHVGDIVAAFDELGKQRDLVIATGGLGPTSDDMTGAALAQAMGVALELHRPSLEAIRKLFHERGREMSPANRKQAEIPVGARALSNDRGTAPGIQATLHGAQIYCFPGVPREMKAMVHHHLLPQLEGEIKEQTHTTRLRCFGIAESTLADKLKDLEPKFTDVDFGYRVRFPEIELRFTARDEARAAALRDAVQARISDLVFGDGTESYPQYFARLMKAQKQRLVLAESCTGGLLGSMLSDVPGSSAFFSLSAVTYANSAKTRLLGVQPELLAEAGAVSEAVAIAMVEGACELDRDADLAVAITGIAGPDGGSADKPVGTTWIAVGGKGRPVRAVQNCFVGNRHQVRIRAAYHAMRMLERLIAEPVST